MERREIHHRQYGAPSVNPLIGGSGGGGLSRPTTNLRPLEPLAELEVGAFFIDDRVWFDSVSFEGTNQTPK